MTEPDYGVKPFQVPRIHLLYYLTQRRLVYYTVWGIDVVHEVEVILYSQCVPVTKGVQSARLVVLVGQSDLAVMEVLCRGTLFPTWVAAQGSMNRDGDIPIEFTDFLMASVAERTGTNLETLMWTGAAPFGTGFLSNDGVIDDAGIDASAMKDFTEADTGALGAWTKANILSVLDLVFDAANATPGILLKPGAGFYVSYEAYAFFLQAIAAQSTNQGYNQDLGGATYLGYPVYPTGGIPNTTDVCVFTYPENIVVGTNNYTPDISAQLIPAYAYDGSDNVKVAMRFGVGVNVGVAGDGVVGFNFA